MGEITYHSYYMNSPGMQDRDDKEYKIGFSGATISKLESNRIGLALSISMLVMVAVCFLFEVENKTVTFAISLCTVFVTYFLVSKKIIKKKTNKNR